jgi:formate--tetrahydrofolate ligase
VVCREISFTPEGGKVLADIEIAQQAKLKRIGALAVGTLGIPEDQIEPYGHYKAKISSEFIASLSDKPDGKLVLVTAISPTPAGEGKTTTQSHWQECRDLSA